jgi:DNA-binding NtrC family response regulator
MHTAEEIDIRRRTASFAAPARKPLVYLAEDDDDIREALAALFAHDGFAVRAAHDGTHLYNWLFREFGPGTRAPDVIVTDHRMPGYCSLDILECLAERHWSVPVIVITAYGAEVRGLARMHGACAVFEKPFEPDDLRIATMHCVRWDRYWQRPHHRTPQTREIASQARRAIRSQVRRIEHTEDA